MASHQTLLFMYVDRWCSQLFGAHAQQYPRFRPIAVDGGTRSEGNRLHIRGDGVSRRRILREQIGVDDFFFVHVHGAGGLHRSERIAVAGAKVEVAAFETGYFCERRCKAMPAMKRRDRHATTIDSEGEETI